MQFRLCAVDLLLDQLRAQSTSFPRRGPLRGAAQSLRRVSDPVMDSPFLSRQMFQCVRFSHVEKRDKWVKFRWRLPQGRMRSALFACWRSVETSLL